MRVLQSNVAPLPEYPAESDLEVSEDDVRFVDEYSQRLGFLKNLNKEKIDRHARDDSMCISCFSILCTLKLHALVSWTSSCFGEHFKHVQEGCSLKFTGGLFFWRQRTSAA
jgi:hypothetical protein